MFVVDTNILVYGANDQSDHHGHCLALLTEWREQSSAWFLTWGIVCEFLRVVTHPRVLQEPRRIGQAWDFIDALLESPGLIMLTETNRHADVAREVASQVPGLAGNLLHDAHTAILMREHGVRRIYTHDTDFHRFRFLEPIDPLTLTD
jgi:toxin-antitoxin system PIN domain toxin